MKKLFALLITSVLLFQPTFADQSKGKEQSGKRKQHMQQLMGELQLSNEQKESFKQIMKEQREKHHAIMNEIHEQVKPKMEAIHDETKQRLATILDEKQLESYNKFAEKKRNHMKERMKQHRQKRSEKYFDTENDQTD